MADIRFKINGDSPPFIANVCIDGTTNIIASEVIEYSCISTNTPHNHTCAIIGGLSQSTTYCVNVIDSVGRITGFTATTPVAPVEPLVSLNVNLGGTIDTVSECVKTLSGSKEIQITPQLFGNKCINVELCTIANHSGDDYADIILYKRCGTSGTYNQLPIDTQNMQQMVCIDIGEGDGVCYDMSSVLNIPTVGESFSCSLSNLSLINITPICGFGSNCCVTSGPQTNICLEQTCCTTTTTTSTTAPQIEVYFDDIQTTNGCDIVAKLCTNPPLQSNQSFRACFYYKNYFCYPNIIDNVLELNALSAVDSSSVFCLTTISSLVSGPVSCVESDNNYRDITQSNINDQCFSVILQGGELNSNRDFEAYSCICICGISNMFNGNYSISGSIPNDASRKIVTSCSGNN